MINYDTSLGHDLSEIAVRDTKADIEVDRV